MISSNLIKSKTGSSVISWAPISNTPGINNVTCVRYTVSSGTTIMALTTGSDSAVSTDNGVTWTKKTMPASASWVDSTSNNFYLVAVASTGQAAYYNSGTWASRPIPNQPWCSVAYGASTWVAVATNSNAIATSSFTNASSWTSRSSGYTAAWKQIIYAAGKFVVIADGIDYVITSPDGITWTQQMLPYTMHCSRFAYGNGKFVAIGSDGYVWSSPDAITWTRTALPENIGSNTWTAITWGNGIFVATTTDYMIYSKDGSDWKKILISGVWVGITHNNGCFCAFSQSGGFTVANSGVAAVIRNLPGTVTLTDMAFGNAKIVTVGGMNVPYRSSDGGITWTGTGGTTFPNSSWSGVAYGNNIFVAVSYGTAIVEVSSDGVTWSSYALPISTNVGSKIAYGNGIFVLTTNSTAVTSTDGINWTQQTLPDVSGTLSYVNGLFCSISASYVQTSPDGVNWTKTALPVTGSWRRVAYGNGVFISVQISNTNIAIISTDGINWTQQTLPISLTWNGVTFGDNIFIAAAGGSKSLITSSDGINWITHTIAQSCSDIFYVGSTFIMINSSASYVVSLKYYK